MVENQPVKVPYLNIYTRAHKSMFRPNGNTKCVILSIAKDLRSTSWCLQILHFAQNDTTKRKWMCILTSLNLKTRTILLHSRQITMPHYPSFRIIFLQTFQQSLEGFLLLRCTGITWPVAGIESAFVADADAVGIVACGVSTHLVKRATGMNHPVAGDVVVIQW